MSTRKHFLLISVAGYGHLIPMVALAKKISQYHKVTFGINSSMIAHIRAKGEFSPEFERTVDILGLDDGIKPGTPEDDVMQQVWAKASTVALPKLQQFMEEMLAHAPPLKSDERRLPCDYQIGNITVPVDVVIVDNFLAKPIVTLSKRNIPFYLFNCASSGSFRSFLYITPKTPVEAMNDLHAFTMLRPESEGPQPAVSPIIQDLALSINTVVDKATGFVINSFRDIEQSYITEMAKDSRMKNMKFYCVGPLIPEEKADHNQNHAALKNEVSSWLDSKPEGSVIYVAFGSVTIPNQNQITQIGQALLNINKPFIFALREEQHALLPKDLLASPKASHMLLPWAPQKIILDHPAVGVFVSHCGWNSTIETIFSGKPVVGLPMFGDQLENALLLEELGMGVSLLRPEAANDKGHRAEMEASQLVKAVETVIGSSSYSTSAKKWMEKVRNAISPTGSSTQELQKLINLS